MEGHIDDRPTELKAGWMGRLSEFFAAEIVADDEHRKKDALITRLRGELHSSEEKVHRVARKMQRYRRVAKKLDQENRILKQSVARHERSAKRERQVDLEEEEEEEEDSSRSECDDYEDNPIVVAWEKRWKGEIEREKNKQKK